MYVFYFLVIFHKRRCEV